MIAALFVEKNGVYANLPEIDVWDESRDARNYRGPWPVIAHPPCQRWCRLAGLVEKRWGHKRGEDNGCFEHALDCVRYYGGVLEHPAYSDAWKAYGLASPSRHGGWIAADGFGGLTCHVEQSRYGHAAKKATWLYYCGSKKPLDLRWGSELDAKSTAIVSWCRNHTSNLDRRPRLGKKAANATPVEFRDELIKLVGQDIQQRKAA